MSPALNQVSNLQYVDPQTGQTTYYSGAIDRVPQEALPSFQEMESEPTVISSGQGKQVVEEQINAPIARADNAAALLNTKTQQKQAYDLETAGIGDQGQEYQDASGVWFDAS